MLSLNVINRLALTDFAEVEARTLALATLMEQAFMLRRELPIALAHELDKCKPGVDHARLAVLNRLFSGCNSRQRIQVRVELRAMALCRSGDLNAAAALRGKL